MTSKKSTPEKFQHFANAGLFITASLCVVIVLSGCAGQNASGTHTGGSLVGAGANTAGAPVQLRQRGSNIDSFAASDDASVLMSIDDKIAKRAIRNYAINKRARLGPYIYRAADLNGDSQPELVAYLTGPDWCASTSCTLVVLRKDAYGYKPVSTIRRVKLPITVSAQKQNGWRTLIVGTGGAAIGERRAALSFSSRGYPGNAMQAPEMPTNTATAFQTIFDTSSLAQLGPSAN